MVKAPPRERQFFSVRDAVAYTGVPYGTLRHDVYITGRLPGVLIGKTTIFTKEQLDDYMANDRRTEIRPDRYTVVEAADYLGVSPDVVEEAVEAGKLKPLILGGNALFVRAQLDEFAARGESDVVPESFPFYGRHEVADYIDQQVETGWGEPEAAVRAHIWLTDRLPAEIVGRSAIIDHRDVETFIEELPVRSRLTDDEVRQIFRLYHTEEGHTHRSLAERFGVSYAQIGRIVNRDSRADVTADLAEDLGIARREDDRS